MNLNDRLVNLAGTGIISSHAADPVEIGFHIDAAKGYLADAKKKSNTNLTRFIVANAAGFSLLTAALKMAGYRTSSEKGHRALLYDILDALLPGASDAKTTLSRAHNARNKAEYEGDVFDPTDGLIEDLVAAVQNVKEEVDFNYKKFKAQRDAKATSAQQAHGHSGSATAVPTAGSGNNKKKPS